MVTEIYDNLVPKMAAPVLQPECHVDYVRYRRDMPKALANLFLLLYKRELHIPSGDGSEFSLARDWEENTKNQGTVDLTAIDNQGQAVIINLKWSGHKRYRELVETHTAIRLA